MNKQENIKGHISVFHTLVLIFVFLTTFPPHKKSAQIIVFNYSTFLNIYRFIVHVVSDFSSFSCFKPTFLQILWIPLSQFLLSYQHITSSSCWNFNDSHRKLSFVGLLFALPQFSYQHVPSSCIGGRQVAQIIHLHSA